MAKTSTRTAQIEAARNAKKSHPWPDEVGDHTEADFDMYRSLQQQRSHSDWTPIDLVELARVAKMMVDAVEEHADLRDEGYIIRGGKMGTTLVENPRNRVLSTLNGTINASLRRLGITSMSVAEKQSQAKRAGLERDNREEDDDRDGLLN